MAKSKLDIGSIYVVTLNDSQANAESFYNEEVCFYCDMFGIITDDGNFLNAQICKPKRSTAEYIDGNVYEIKVKSFSKDVYTLEYIKPFIAIGKPMTTAAVSDISKTAKMSAKSQALNASVKLHEFASAPEGEPFPKAKFYTDSILEMADVFYNYIISE